MKCYKCKWYIEKSKVEPFNAFDFISGNENGTCNHAEKVNPIEMVIDTEECNFINKED